MLKKLVVLIFGLIITCIGLSKEQQTLSVFSLNLHGYHPQGQAPRYFEHRNGKFTQTRPAPTDLFYFTLDELSRGQQTRLDQLSLDLEKIKPDIILLQEVGAGHPFQKNDCSEFNRSIPDDKLEKNTALRLQSRLKAHDLKYKISLACRGNIGWQTTPRTFSDKRILKKGASKSYPNYEVVFDYNSNPYPNGILVEGLALLVSSHWRIVQTQSESLNIPGTSETFFFQWALISAQNAKVPENYLILNVHGPHKVRHFEVATQIQSFISSFAGRLNSSMTLSGVIVGGDFNSYLYRAGEKYSEISSLPWDFRVANRQTTAFSNETFVQWLYDQLISLNDDPKFKPWASLGDNQQARDRIFRAARDYSHLVSEKRIHNLHEALDSAVRNKKCYLADLDFTCHLDERIDFIFYSEKLNINKGALLYHQNDYFSTRGVSDHPAMYVEWSRVKN